VVDAAAAGESDARRLEEMALIALDVPGLVVDYLALVDGSSLEPLPHVRAGARLLVAVDVGGTRLIDNAAIEPPPSGTVQ
jgi:pantoate--beta-alanine ligase